MSDVLKTVKIRRGDRATIINESDFDPKVHELFDAPAKAAKADGDSDPLPIAEVLAMASAEDVHFKTFEAAAKKHLGDDTPKAKADIITALEAKAKAEAE